MKIKDTKQGVGLSQMATRVRGRALAAVIPCLAGLVATTAVGQDSSEGPTNEQVNFKEIKVNGSGCPVNSTTEIITNEKPGRPFTYFQVTYDSFSVDLGPNAKESYRKFCNIALGLEYPVGWQYTIVELQTNGYAQIAKGAEGMFQSSYQFRGKDNLQKLQTKTLESGFVGDYEVTAKATNEKMVWSDCESRIPLNIKSTIMLSGDDSEDSTMAVDVQSGLMSQTYEIRWKKCKKSF